MPRAIFSSGAQTATARGGARHLIPGVEPGGQRAGKSKPVLLIRDARDNHPVLHPDQTAAGVENVRTYLALSQESDLDPALLLPVSSVWMNAESAVAIANITPLNTFADQGTMWAPQYVGWYMAIAGTWSDVRAEIILDYEMVMVPWRDWFVMWEFLDGIVDLEQEY